MAGAWWSLEGGQRQVGPTRVSGLASSGNAGEGCWEAWKAIGEVQKWGKFLLPGLLKLQLERRGGVEERWWP